MSGVIRVPDLPDLGTVTDDTSVVGEHMGTGRIVATALRDYVQNTAGGPFLPLTGGTLTGTLFTNATSDIVSGRNAFVSGFLGISEPDFTWQFYVDGSDNRIQSYNGGQYYDEFVSGTATRMWHGDLGVLMSLGPTGTLWLREALSAPDITATTMTVSTLTAAAINAPSAPITSGAITSTTINASGVVTAAGGFSTGGDVNANNVNVSGQLSFGSGYRMAISGGNREIFFSSNWRLSWEPAGGNLSYVRDDNSTAFTSFGANSDFFIGGSVAYKTGGGSWTAPSDSRIKTVTGDYTRGLADILALAPKRFTYRGNDTRGEPAGEAAPYTNSPNYNAAKAGTEFVGLVAQDIETSWPEMVSSLAGYIDGEAADILTVDRSDINLALVNAMKELETRVAALEGALARAQASAAAKAPD